MSRTLRTVFIILAGAGTVTLALFYFSDDVDPPDSPETVSLERLPQMGLMSRSPDQPRKDEGTFYIGKLSLEGKYNLKVEEKQKACFLTDEKYIPDLPEKERAFCFTNIDEALTLLVGEKIDAGCFEGRAEITFEGLFVSRVGESETRLLEIISSTAPQVTESCP